MHSNKSKIAKIVLSVTALLLISVIAFGTTFSWIEGGTTLSIRTENKGDVATSELPEVGGVITLDPATTKNIDLITFDETSKYYKTLGGDQKNVYFSPAASTDGENFLFPVTDSLGNTVFRNHNTNDIGTKLISFDFTVKGTEKCYLAFTKAPEITLTKNGKPVDFDASAFRFCIKTPSATRIFSTSTDARDVVVDSAGNVESFTGLTAFDSYINKEDTTNNKLFSLTSTSTGYRISVSVWLDYTDANLDVNSAIFGSDVKINLNLTVGQEKVKANFEAVTFLNDKTTPTTDVGGTVDPESGWFPIGKKINATAQPVPGYYFDGWYTDAECNSPVDGHDSDDFTLEVNTPTNASAGDEVTYYARFVEMEDMIYFVPKSNWASDNAWFAAYVWKSSTNSNEFVTLTDTDGDGVYSAVVPDTHDYDKVIFVRLNPAYSTPAWNTDSVTNRVWNQTDDLSLPTSEKTLFVKDNGNWGGTGTWYAPLTVSAVSGGNGTATANNVAHAVSYNSGTVALAAVADTGYEFAGWFTDSAFTSNIGSTYKTANQNVTVTGSKTYYAKFTKIPVLTVNAIVSPADSGCTATVNDASTASVQTGATVNLKATTVRGYKFKGWYVGSATGSTIGSEYNSTSTTYKVTGSDGEVINLYAVFEKLPAVTIKTVATPAAGGTATVNGVTSYNAFDGETVGLAATKAVNTNYVFTGWYTDPECTDKFNNAATISNYVVDGTDGQVIYLYAKFVKAYNAYGYAYTDGSKGVSGGTVTVTTTSSTATSTTSASVNPASVQVYEGDSVTFTASKISGYNFTGWYTSENASSPVETSTELTVSNVTAEQTYYAKFEKDNTVYLKPNSNWTQAGARFAIYVFNDSTSTNAWVSMTEDSDHSGYYKATIPDGDWEGIIFCRMSGSATANNWSNKWNQTADLSLPSGSKNIYKVPSGNDVWDGSDDSNWSSSF